MPVHSLAKALAHTFKRDYVRGNPLPDAKTVIKLIRGWVKDYNENHPHSAREFRAAQAETA